MIFRYLWRNGFQNISPLLCYIRHWRKWRPVTKSLFPCVCLSVCQPQSETLAVVSTMDLHCTSRLYYTGWPLTWKTWKNQGIPKLSGKSQGRLKSVSLYRPTTTDTSTGTGVIYCVILHLLQPQCIKCQILKAHWLPGLLLINMKQRRLTIVLNSILMNLCLPYWKSLGKVRESRVIWKVATLVTILSVWWI